MEQSNGNGYPPMIDWDPSRKLYSSQQQWKDDNWLSIAQVCDTISTHPQLPHRQVPLFYLQMKKQSFQEVI